MLINLTPHTIVLARKGGDDLVIVSTGVARVTTIETQIGEADGFPVFQSQAGPVTGLPDAVPGVWLVVSAMVKGQLPHRTDVLSPDTGPSARRNAQGQVEAVFGLKA